ncbi:MAG TPA: hypothetical protein VEF03_06715, partial [Candidatus Binataceae bacterium]|nr:hypothetical protein [Candidatus Binataceae bacterium]
MMNTAQDAAIFTEGFADDDCTNERSGADWFKARAVPLPTFVGRPAEPARELAAAIQDAMARPQSFAAADELAQEQFA